MYCMLIVQSNSKPDSKLSNKVATGDMRDVSSHLSWALSYCPLKQLSRSGKLLHIQMISPIELIAVSLGRELKDEHQHGHTYTQ